MLVMLMTKNSYVSKISVYMLERQYHQHMHNVYQNSH